MDSQITVNSILYKLPFNAQRDLQPVTLLNKVEHILVVHPSVPATTLKEFIALAKQKPGSLNYASAGVGSSLHMHAELLKRRTGIELLHVAYSGGAPAASVLAGETQVLAGTVASTIGSITAGRLRALAIMGATRSKLLPDLPTVAESGYPGFEANSWYALLVPGVTPQSIAARIRDETIKALLLPDVPIAMARQGLIPITSSQTELATRIKTETDMWASIIKDAGIRAE